MRLMCKIPITRQPYTIELITTLVNQWKPKLKLFMGGTLTFELRGDQLWVITDQRKCNQVEWSMRLHFRKKKLVTDTVMKEGFEEFLRLFQHDLEKPVVFIDSEDVEEPESEEDEPDEEPE